jgi:E3 ubiquitin-protein ligase BRE1
VALAHTQKGGQKFSPFDSPEARTLAVHCVQHTPREPQSGPFPVARFVTVLVEMESRKRLGSDSSVASSSRPAKRIATDSDQIPIQTDPFSYDDLTFINEFRREAIYRSLVAERRETARLKESLQQREDHAVFHDDHIRSIDLWLKQLLEELSVSCGQYDPSMSGTHISQHITFLD